MSMMPITAPSKTTNTLLGDCTTQTMLHTLLYKNVAADRKLKGKKNVTSAKRKGSKDALPACFSTY